jgi:hypothetical protein
MTNRILLDAIAEKCSNALLNALPQELLGSNYYTHYLQIQDNDGVGDGDNCDDHRCCGISSRTFFDVISNEINWKGGSNNWPSPLRRSLLPRPANRYLMAQQRNSGSLEDLHVIVFDDATTLRMHQRRVSVASFLESFTGMPSEGLTWAHAKSRSVVRQIALALRLHPFVEHSFSSPDMTSILNHLDKDSVVLTATGVFSEAAELHSHKLCMLGHTRHFLLTFETRLLEPPDQMTKEGKENCTHLPSSHFSLHRFPIEMKTEVADDSSGIMWKDKIFLEGLAALMTDDATGTSVRRLVLKHGAGFLASLLLQELAALTEAVVADLSHAARSLHEELYSGLAQRHRIRWIRDLSLVTQGLELAANHMMWPARGLPGSFDLFRSATFTSQPPVSCSAHCPAGSSSCPPTFSHNNQRRHAASTTKGTHGGGLGVHMSRSTFSSSTFSSVNARVARRMGNGNIEDEAAAAPLYHDSRPKVETAIAENSCIHRELWPFFQDLQDATAAQLRRIETLQQTLPEMRSTLTYMGNLKSISIDTTLSMVATIFLPLNFLAGIFGSECKRSLPKTNQ